MCRCRDGSRPFPLLQEDGGRKQGLEAVFGQMPQVKRTLELGLGAKNLSEMRVLKQSLDKDPGFGRLIKQVQTLPA